MRKHPDLGRKLSALYRNRLNPNVLNNVELGKRLGVSKQAVSRWCRGTATQIGDSIPDYQLIPLSDVFGIEPLWFTLSYSEFDTAIRSRVTANESALTKDSEKVSISMMPSTGLNIFGRRDEIEILNDCWQSNTTNVLQIVAFGGVGKSSLVNKWLSELSKERYRYASRVYAWSFHWQGNSTGGQSSGDFFIEHALQWFGDENPTSGTPWSKATRLAKMIRARRTLIILDGLEVLQRPPGHRMGEVKSPAVALLLKELAVKSDGLCVVTSRLGVKDLEAYADGRCRSLNLQNLATPAGVEVLKSFGLRGSESSYLQAVDAYSGHPLSLSLLAGFLNVVFGGDMDRQLPSQSLLDPKDNNEQVQQLMRTYITWFENSPDLDLLFLVALFGGITTLGDLKEFVQENDIDLVVRLKKFSHADWAYSVAQLKSSNLVQVSTDSLEMTLDCHPIVRDYLIDRFKLQDLTSFNLVRGSIFDFLLSRVSLSSQTTTQMEQLFRLVILGAQAGKFREAFRLYYNNVKKRFVMLPEGCHYMDQACIDSFFTDDSWENVADELTIGEEYYLKSSAAANLMTLGRIDEATLIAKEAIQYFIENQDWKSACQTAGPLISAMIEAGKLKESTELLASLEGVISAVNDPVVTALSLSFQGYALFLRGELSEAEKLFLKAESLLDIESPDFEVIAPVVTAYYGKYLIEVGKAEMAISHLLRTAMWREQATWQVTFDTPSLEASDILVLGLAYMAAGDLESASIYLEKQVDLFRSANEWLYLPTGLNSRARYHIEVEDFVSAQEDLEESIDVSKRTGARFGEWEAYIEFAELCLRKNCYQQGLSYLDKAESMRDMQSYRYRKHYVEKLRERLKYNASKEKAD